MPLPTQLARRTDLSQAAVRQINERAGIPCERVMQSVRWLGVADTRQLEINRRNDA